MRGGIGLRTEIFWVDLSPWYRVCTKAIFISKGSYGYEKHRNVFHYSVEKFSVLGPISPSMIGGSLPARTGKWKHLRKLGWTYSHGTVFAPMQCLNQKEATGM